MKGFQQAFLIGEIKGVLGWLCAWVSISNPNCASITVRMVLDRREAWASMLALTSILQ
jgi:hypothetical protein